MKLLSRTQFGNPILRAKAKKVPLSFLKTDAFTKLIGDMFYTMRRAHGVGLAAPQIGQSLQMAVMHVAPTKHRANIPRLPKTVIINPVVLEKSKEMVDDWEGCLSCKDVRGKVPRHKRIQVRYTNEHGEVVTTKVEGFVARVFQHEIDHLHGMVYVDRMHNMSTLMTLSEYTTRILTKK